MPLKVFMTSDSFLASFGRSLGWMSSGSMARIVHCFLTMAPPISCISFSMRANICWLRYVDIGISPGLLRVLA